MAYKQKEVEKQLNIILELGSDASLYVKVRMLLVSMAEKAEKGDEDAIQILAIVKRFSKLVELAETMEF